ncbi:hypothetical protein [Streptomyces sp. NPDC051211]|uniref:hypothetical protein n=1 Tax=Streptomyces sp. NPDC051211 TaxID=3154643 RepID=UPI00344BD09A
MPRLLRYLIIWLTCTAASVAVVTLAARFVVGSTRPTAPVAQSAQEDISGGPSAVPSATRSGPAATGEPGPQRTAKPAAAPTPSKPTRTAHPAPTTSRSGGATPAAPGSAGPDPECAPGGAGTHTVPSQGGKATVRYGSRAVCLISAVPHQGYSVKTRQVSAQTLVVTFTGASHRSEITATITPTARASVRETSSP